MRTACHAPTICLMLLSGLWWTLPGLSAAEEQRQPAFPPAESAAGGPQQPHSAPPAGGGLHSPLINVPGHWQTASQEEGPVVGLWRVLTATEHAVPSNPPPVAAPGKAAKPRPLSLRDYLNQQGTQSTTSGQLLELGF